MTLLMLHRSTFRAWLIPCLCSKVHETLLLWLCAQSSVEQNVSAGWHTLKNKIQYCSSLKTRRDKNKKRKKNFSAGTSPYKTTRNKTAQVYSFHIIVDTTAYSFGKLGEKGLLHASLTLFIITCTKATVKREEEEEEGCTWQYPHAHSS